MKIQVTKTVPDETGHTLPEEMVGKIFDIKNQCNEGVWVDYLGSSFLVVKGEYETIDEDGKVIKPTYLTIHEESLILDALSCGSYNKNVFNEDVKEQMRELRNKLELLWGWE
jgi:hypothetical protein